MTSSLPICSTAAAITAIASVFGHDLGRSSPGTVHRPSRRRREIKRSTKRIGTSLGRMRSTLWPITINAPSRTSRRDPQRSPGVSARSPAYAAAACRIYVEVNRWPRHAAVRVNGFRYGAKGCGCRTMWYTRGHAVFLLANTVAAFANDHRSASCRLQHRFRPGASSGTITDSESALHFHPPRNRC